MFKEIIKKIKSQSKGFVIGSIITGIMMSMTTGFADGILKNIQVGENTVSLKVNGKQANSSNYVINGRTYVQVRDICDLLNKELLWDSTTNTVNINDKDVIPTNSTLPTLDIEDSKGKVDSVTTITSTPTPTSVSVATSTPTPATTAISSTSVAIVNVNTIFRNVRFGMTKDEVVKSEGTEPTKIDKDTSSTMLIYKNVKIAGHESDLIYELNKANILCNIIVLFNDSHTNKNDYINDYNKSVKILEEKYGAAKSSDIIWKNNLYKDDSQDYGFAISLGHLIYISRWDLDSATIACSLNGENYNIRNGFMIQSKTIEQPKQDSGM